MKVMISMPALAAFFAVMVATPVIALETAPVVTSPQQIESLLQNLQKENGQLQEKVRMLESTPHIDSTTLSRKTYQRLQDISRDTKVQQQVMADFEVFVKWMANNLSGYSKYIEAGSFAAGFAKVLPIPYAGQASVLTKFISQGVLSLNSASVSISRYLTTSRQFVARVEALEKTGGPENAAGISETARFADGQLLRDMNDARVKLAAAAEISSSTLSFLESLNHYIGCTDAYWNKTKAFITRAEADKKEKSYLSQSIQNLKNRTGNFNAKLKLFEEAAKKDEPLIKSMAAYEELINEMNIKAVQTRLEPVSGGK